MNNSTPSHGSRQAVAASLKDVEIVNPDRAREIRAEKRGLATWEYFQKFGVNTPAEYIGAGCPKPLGYSTISARSAPPLGKPEVGTGVVRLYENDLEVKAVGAKRPKYGGARGVIVGQSDRSLNRFMKFLNRLRWPDKPGFFISLTFPDKFPNSREAKRCLRALLKRLTRQYPFLADVWREEWKRRKSGAYAGEVAPHFHMFIWLDADEIELGDFIRRAWADITYNGSSEYAEQLIHGADVLPVTNRKQACHYITKYMTKSENDAQIEGGRPWGHSANLDASALWALLLTQAQIALLRKLVEQWAWRVAQELASVYRFIARMMLFPSWMGWHVYGMGEADARSMLERVLNYTGGMDGIQAALEVAR